MDNLNTADLHQEKLEKYHRYALDSGTLKVFRDCRKDIVKHENGLLKEFKIQIKKNKYFLNDLNFLKTNSQNLLNNLLNNQKLSLQVINSIGLKKRIKYPIPTIWHRFFIQKGFRINRLSCYILWNLYLWKNFIANYFSAFITFWREVQILAKKPSMEFTESLIPYVYFHDFKQNYADEGHYNFANWCIETKELNNMVYFHSNPLCKNSVTVRFKENLFLAKNIRCQISNFIGAIRVHQRMFFKYGIKNTAFVPIKEIHTLLNLVSKKVDARNEYLFLDSNRLRKPLWVNYLEQIDSRVVYIETSQYIEPLDLGGNELYDDFENLNDWSEVWTVSNDRMNFLAQLNKEKTLTIKNLGLPWMFDHNFEIGSIAKPILSIFDVEPHRFYFGWTTYNIYGLQRIQFATRFLEDIMSVANELDLYVLHKPKRNIGENRYPEYSKLISYFIENFPDNYCLLEPNVSLYKIIQNSIHL